MAVLTNQDWLEGERANAETAGNKAYNALITELRYQYGDDAYLVLPVVMAKMQERAAATITTYQEAEED